MLLKDLLYENSSIKKTAVKFGNTDISYEELYKKVKDTSELIIKNNLSCTNIGLFLPNSLKYIIGYFAIAFLDKVIVPINILEKGLGLQRIVKYADLEFIISDTEYIKKIKIYLKNFNCRIAVFNIDTGQCLMVGAGKKSIKYIVEPAYYANNENRVTLLLHTSGSTSNPKRVMLTHKNLISNIKAIIESLNLQEHDRTLIVLPLCMATANASQMLTHLYLGATIVIMDSLFLPNVFLKIVENERITNFTGVPSTYYSLLEFIKRKHISYDVSSLRHIGFVGAKMSIGKIHELIDAFPHTGVVHMYGQTEATRITHLLAQDSLRKIGSVGKPLPGIEVKVVDENGSELPRGQIGELIVKGDNVMPGYYKRPAESRNALIDGWLFTGDLGWCDTEGYLYISGRKKNMLISGGINIYPEEIEDVLMSHPAVKETCVVGKAHDFLGEVPVAHVSLNIDYSNTNEEELINYCFERLAAYKTPVNIYFVDEILKTKTGKIKRSNKEC